MHLRHLSASCTACGYRMAQPAESKSSTGSTSHSLVRYNRALGHKAILYLQAVHDALRCLRCIFSTKNSDDSYMPSSGSIIRSDMPQPLAPQTTCNDKESEDLAIQLKEAVATAELLEGAIKSILSSFDLYTEKYDRYINKYLIPQRDIFTN